MNKDNQSREEDRKVFISYSHADRPFVEQLAKALLERGQDVWFDKWDIAPGDSIIRKIFEEGLAEAIAFIVVLSEASVKSPWVKEELNVATLRRIEEVTKVIPVLKENVEIPMSLRPLRWVDMREQFDEGVRDILNALHGITEKPPLGKPPAYLTNMPESVGDLSKVATQVGKFILQATDPDGDDIRWFRGNELAEKLGLTPQEIDDAVDELKEQGLVQVHLALGTAPFSFHAVEPTYVLHLHFADFLDYDPTSDIKIVAATVVALSSADGKTLEQKTGLSPGRLNRAVDYMRDYGIVETIDWLGASPYTFGQVNATRRTRQFALGN